MDKIETREFEYHIEFPKNFILLLKESGGDIFDREVQSVINAVNYDIARKLEYSDDGMHTLYNVLQRIKDRWGHLPLTWKVDNSKPRLEIIK